MSFSFSPLPSMLVLRFLNSMFRVLLPKHESLRLSYVLSSASPECLCSPSAASFRCFVDFLDILSLSNFLLLLREHKITD